MAGRLRELGFEVGPGAPSRRAGGRARPVGARILAAAVRRTRPIPAALPRRATRLSSFPSPPNLVQKKTPGYVARTHPTVEEAIGWIHDAAGVAVWAHPFWDIKSDDEVLAAIDRYRAAGLDGVEVFYTSHSREQTLLLAERCEQLGLLRTGSSDYHGPDHSLSSEFRAFEEHGPGAKLGPSSNGTRPARRVAATALCVWLTGLSGSGKSTIGRSRGRGCRDRGRRVEVLDGDDVRQNLCAGLGFSREDRDINVHRIAWVANLLSRNGVVTFVAAVSPFRAARDQARAIMGPRFVEVHVRASVEECERRDVKGPYEKARAGEIEGCTAFPTPEGPLAPETADRHRAGAAGRNLRRGIASSKSACSVTRSRARTSRPPAPDRRRPSRCRRREPRRPLPAGLSSWP